MKRCTSCKTPQGERHKQYCKFTRHPQQYPDGAVYTDTGSYSSWSDSSSSSCDTGSSSSSDGGSCG